MGDSGVGDGWEMGESIHPLIYTRCYKAEMLRMYFSVFNHCPSEVGISYAMLVFRIASKLFNNLGENPIKRNIELTIIGVIDEYRSRGETKNTTFRCELL